MRLTGTGGLRNITGSLAGGLVCGGAYPNATADRDIAVNKVQ